MNRIVAPLLALAITCLLLMAEPAAQAQTDHWVATWATSQTLVRTAAAVTAGPGRSVTPPAASPSPPPAPAPGPFPARRFPVPTVLTSVNNQTVRMIVRSTMGGRQVRVRLSNAFSGTTVTIGSASLALSKGGATIDASTSHALTFSGRRTASIYAGQVLISDPVALSVPALTDLAVSLYLPGDVDSPTNHRFGLRTTYLGAGDVTMAADIPGPFTTSESVLLAGGRRRARAAAHADDCGVR